MNYYETLYIIHPALESGRLKDIIMEVEDSLKKLGGGPLAINLWGKRKLAYFIDKQKYGTYVLVQYNGEGKCTRDFAVELEHNPNILAYLTTNISQDDLIEQDDDLETQIAGKTRENEKNENEESKSPNYKNKRGVSAEVISQESSGGDGDEQTSTKNEDIKTEGNEAVITDDSEQVDIIEKSDSIDENKSSEEGPSKETILESNQEKPNEPSTIGEEK